jgi:hypothetical protein
VAVRAGDKKTLERLCRYITRPALADGTTALRQPTCVDLVPDVQVDPTL